MKEGFERSRSLPARRAIEFGHTQVRILPARLRFREPLTRRTTSEGRGGVHARGPV
jgi:hypothetical protein